MVDKNPIDTLASIIKKGADERAKEIHTAMPGIVVSFDAANQLASVQPAIRRIFKTREQDEEILVPSDLPVLINVPVVFPRGGGFSLTFPVKKGDECLLIFCERSIDLWHQSGKVSNPGARRFHHLSDATAFVGLSSKPNKVPSYNSTDTELKKDDGSAKVVLTSAGKVEVSSTSEVKADAPVITATATSSASVTAPAIALNGAVTINGTLLTTGAAAFSSTITNQGKNIGFNHSHTQGNDSGGNVEQNTGGVV